MNVDDHEPLNVSTMENGLYGRFCRICTSCLSVQRYRLYRSSCLTNIGRVLLQFSGEELVPEAQYDPKICLNCYKRLTAIVKEEENLNERWKALCKTKDEIRVKVAIGGKFFANAGGVLTKRSRNPVSPGTTKHSPCTPPPKKTSSTKYPSTLVRRKCMKDLSLRFRHDSKEEKATLDTVTCTTTASCEPGHELLAKALYSNKGTQTIGESDVGSPQTLLDLQVCYITFQLNVCIL